MLGASGENPRLSGQAAWVVVWRVVGIVVTIAANILAARLLGPADFGAFLIVTTTIALGSVLAMGGMSEAGLRFISESLGLSRTTLARAYLRRVLLVTGGTSLVGALIIAIGLTAFQAVTGELRNPVLITALATAGVVALAWQQIAAELLRGYGDLRFASLFSGGQTGGPFSNLLYLSALGVAAVLLGTISTSLALGLLAASIWITMPLAFLALWRVSSTHPAPADIADPSSLSREQGRQLLAAAGSLLVIQLLTSATYQLDIWIGGLLLTPKDLGLYGVAKRCQLLGQIPVQMAMMTVVSIVPRMRVQNRLADLEEVVRRAATLAAIPSVAAMIILALFPATVLQALFGGAYLGAAHVVLPLVMGQLAHILFGNPAYVLTMTGHHHLVLRVNVFTTLLLVIAGSLGAWLAGPVGLALGSAASMTVQNGLLWWFAKQRLGIGTHVQWPSRDFLQQAAGKYLPSAWQKKPVGDDVAEPLTAVPVAVAEQPTPPVARAAAGSGTPRRLWWLNPGWAFALAVGPTMVAAWSQSENAYLLYGTPKYVETEHLLMSFAAIAVFALGCALAQVSRTNVQATRPETDGLVRFWFYLTSFLTIFGYVVWFGIGFKNGFTFSMFLDLLRGGDDGLYDSIRAEFFPTLPGVTTCAQFSVAAVLLGTWLFIHGERRILWPLAIILPIAALRSILFSERTALLELVFPMAFVGLRVYILGRPIRPLVRTALFVAPVVGVIGLLLFFGFYEFFRSWNFYKPKFDSYAEFTVWRLSGYFTSALNNGCMALMTNQPRPLPYFTLRPLWEFPGVSQSSFSYEALTGIDLPASMHAMLERYGTIELNNEGGLFQPALDYGWGGFLIYWCGYGFLSGKLYRKFLAGTLLGITVYPLVYLSLLEVPLILLLFFTRFFPPMVALLTVSWLASRIEARLKSPAPALAQDAPMADTPPPILNLKGSS